MPAVLSLDGRITLLFALFLIHLAGGSARAQVDSGRVSNLYVDGGILRPVSPDGFHSLWKTGNRMGVGAEWETPDVFTLRTGVTYNSLLLDRASAERELGELPSGRAFEDFYYLVEGAVDVLLHAPAPAFSVTPYAVVGLGVQVSDVAPLPIDRSVERSDLEAETRASLMIDAGLGLRRSVIEDVDVFSEVLLVGAFTGGNDKAYTSLTLGMAVQL